MNRSHSHRQEPDDSRGWCCDGRTWAEHASDEGHCCQLEGTSIDELPPDGRRLANERLLKEAPEKVLPAE